MQYAWQVQFGPSQQLMTNRFFKMCYACGFLIASLHHKKRRNIIIHENFNIIFDFVVILIREFLLAMLQAELRGSPLVVSDASSRSRLVGVASWRFGCDQNFPGVYSNIQHFMFWITQIVHRDSGVWHQLINVCRQQIFRFIILGAVCGRNTIDHWSPHTP